MEATDKIGSSDPSSDSYHYVDESTLTSDVKESEVDFIKNDNDGCLPEKSISATAGKQLIQSDHIILAAPEYHTSKEEKLDIPMLGEEEALISLKRAKAVLTREILKVLDEKFKGSLTRIRHVDEHDQIF